MPDNTSDLNQFNEQSQFPSNFFKTLPIMPIVISSNLNNNGSMEVTIMKERLAKLETHVEHIQSDIHEIKSEINTIRWWIAGSAITIIIGLCCIVMAFGTYQATWFQKSLDRNWEISQKSLDKIEAFQLRLGHRDVANHDKQKE